MMTVSHQLGGGQDLDDILRIIARTVTEVIGFDAVAVNVRRDGDELVVRAVVGPPEIERLRGQRMSESGWRSLLESCERWGGLYFSRSPDLPADAPSADPWQERLPHAAGPVGTPETTGFLESEPWQAEFALLAPVWENGHDGGRLRAVLSVDLPRSGHTPDPEQQLLLELFAAQVGTAIDRVTESEDAMDRVSLYRAAFMESPLATAMVDADVVVTDVNDAFMHLIDAVPGETDDRRLSEFLDVDPEEFAASLRRLQPGQVATAAHEQRLRDPRGVVAQRWVDVTARRVDSLHDDPRYVCTLADRTAARAERESLRHRADHDALTGLVNRGVLFDDLEARVSRRATAPTELGHEVLGVLFCDLDGFKSVNDLFGHAAGDGILIAVADTLRAVCGPSDAISRWGGDEFAVTASRGSITEIAGLAAAIVSAVAESPAGNPVPGQGPGVTISIGVAALRTAGLAVTATELIDAADGALYRAKSRTTGNIAVTEV